MMAEQVRLFLQEFFLSMEKTAFALHFLRWIIDNKNNLCYTSMDLCFLRKDSMLQYEKQEN
ncbi:hypothetical protein [Anaerovibrio slackiae]|uniref:hypothetical protein n=1 Tax=Anaerovibrio slackiae TaxID=2652309 RepID=UPI00386686FB